jgi:hypothetical protein
LDKILFAIERGIEQATGSTLTKHQVSTSQSSCEF